MKKIIFLFFVLLCLTRETYSQNKIIDSLKAVIDTAGENKNKAKTLNQLSWQLIQVSDLQPAMKYADQALALATKLKLPISMANAYNKMGIIHSTQGNYPQALKDQFESLKLFEKEGRKGGIANALSNIGVIYSYQSDHDNALVYHKKALAMQQAMADSGGIAGSLHNIGVVYNQKGDKAGAIANFNSALELNKRTGNKDWLANNYGALAVMYSEGGDQQKALEYERTALGLRTEVGNREGIADSYANLGRIYLLLKEYAKAAEYLNRSLTLSLEVNSKEVITSTYLSLAKLDSITGNFRGSLNNYRLYIAYRDSLENEENTKKNVQTEMLYEFDKKEAATRAEQEKKEAIAAADKKKARIVLLAISGFGLLVLGFALFAWRSFLQKKRANLEISRQKELIEEKQKEILDSIYYARRIQQSLLPSEKYLSRKLKELTK